MRLRSTTPFLWAGALAVVFGVAALAWPLHTAAALAVLWGVYAVVDGAVHLWIGTRPAARGARGWLVGTGVLGILTGLLVIALPGIGAAAVVWILATWLVLRGVLMLASGRSRGPGRSLSVLGGILWILAGVVLFLNPAAGAATLSVLAGIFALVIGLVVLAGALFFRSIGNRVRDARAQATARYDAAGAQRAPGFGGVRPVEDRRRSRFDDGNVIEGETK